MSYKRTQLIYENPLACKADTEGFIMEGQGTTSFPMGRMRMESTADPELRQKANIVYWFDRDFPENVELSWDFYTVKEPGLAIVFFAAKGREGQDLFDPSLKKREGPYGQYNDSDINALHISYFRRRWPVERAFSLVNLRKSKGFHLVAQGADPIPTVMDQETPYRIKVAKYGAKVEFYIGFKDTELKLFEWEDDGKTYGDILRDGKVGFRQMCPLIAEYANFKAYEIEEE